MTGEIKNNLSQTRWKFVFPFLLMGLPLAVASAVAIWMLQRDASSFEMTEKERVSSILVQAENSLDLNLREILDQSEVSSSFRKTHFQEGRFYFPGLLSKELRPVHPPPLKTFKYPSIESEILEKQAYSFLGTGQNQMAKEAYLQLALKGPNLADYANFRTVQAEFRSANYEQANGRLKDLLARRSGASPSGHPLSVQVRRLKADLEAKLNPRSEAYRAAMENLFLDCLQNPGDLSNALFRQAIEEIRREFPKPSSILSFQKVEDIG